MRPRPGPNSTTVRKMDGTPLVTGSQRTCFPRMHPTAKPRLPCPPQSCHKQAWERYNYLYSDDEMREWLDRTAKIAAQTEHTYVFFNNHYNAQAVQNAGRFVELLQEADLAG